MINSIYPSINDFGTIEKLYVIWQFQGICIYYFYFILLSASVFMTTYEGVSKSFEPQAFSPFR